MKKLPKLFQPRIAMLLAGVVAASSATAAVASQRDSEVQSIVGSWKVVDDNNGTTFFGTYTGGPFRGTVMFSLPNIANSLTHGEWRRTGRRTFTDTDSAFIYGEDGQAREIITFRAKIEVARDGQTASFTFAFERTDLSSGERIEAGSSTGTGTRISVRPL